MTTTTDTEWPLAYPWAASGQARTPPTPTLEEYENEKDDEKRDFALYAGFERR